MQVCRDGVNGKGLGERVERRWRWVEEGDVLSEDWEESWGEGRLKTVVME